MRLLAPTDHDGDALRLATAAAAEIGLEAEVRLRRSAYLALRDVSCILLEGSILRLRGRLPSHYLKQVAQALVAGIEGVRQVDNQIVVAATGVLPEAARDVAPRAAGASPA